MVVLAYGVPHAVWGLLFSVALSGSSSTPTRIMRAVRRADAVLPVLSRGHAWLCFFLGRRGSAVLSSSEAEYVAMALGLKEAISASSVVFGFSR